MTDASTPSDNRSQVKVVLCDDHPIWRSGVRADLGENFWVVGEAGKIGRASCRERV